MTAVQISASQTNSAELISWAQANQACLVMEFARLRRRLRENGAGSSNAGAADESFPVDLLQQLQDARQSIRPAAAIDVLTETFSLTSFERDILLLCAGIEMDSALAQLCGNALGRDHRSSINFALALAMLASPHWSALSPTAPLRRFQLIALDSGLGLTAAPLRIDERILHYLAGVTLLDQRLEPLLQLKSRPRLIAEEHEAQAHAIADTLDITAPGSPVLHLCGDDPRGQEDLAAIVAHRAGRQLYVLPVENIANAAAATSTESSFSEVSQLIALWTREAALLPAILLVQCGIEGLRSAARQLVEKAEAPVIVASRDPLRLQRSNARYMVNKPDPASQKNLWKQALGPAANSLNGHLDDLSEQFRLSAGTIATVGSAAILRDGILDTDRLWSTCRSVSQPRLEDLAERIRPSAAWNDLILPNPQKQMLHQLAAQARYRLTVYESWGFSDRGRRGLGISALFAGASGTGKTLAAEVLARELQLDLYRIDLSAVVSKYIGESEKNLKQVFDAAEEGGVLLLFDEADALFGKRAEVKDSHDRYANIEVSYLLQRMENFQGLAVLTSNLKSSLDKAFQRRLRFTVDFPFPGTAEREAIWSRVFPAKAPTFGLDIKRLGRLNMTGGNIRNIALNAAFLAAEARSAITMELLLQATRQEAVKIERPLSEAEVRGWI